MNTFKQLTLMAAILLGIQGLGASPVVEEEGTADKLKTPPAAEAEVAKADSSAEPGDADKGEGAGSAASKGKNRPCRIL